MKFLLERMRDYIEKAELEKVGEWGVGETLEERIKEKKPFLYEDVLRELI